MTQVPSIEEAIELIIGRFNAASQGQDVLLNTVLALRDLIWALEHPGRGEASSGLIARLDDAIADVTPTVGREVGHSLPSSDVQLGLQAATGLLRLTNTPCDDVDFARLLPLAQDRIDHIALLADELDALFRRRQIDARGNPFRTSITGSQLTHQSASSATLH